MFLKLTRKHYIFIILVFFSFCYKAEAKIIISEVSISPTDKRFIELYNSSSSSVSLTGYYIQRKTESGSDFTSLVSKTYFEGVSISGGGYLVISRSSDSYTDILVPNLTLTASNTLQLKNPAKEVVDSISFGELGEGQSINKDLAGSKSTKSITPGSGSLESNQDEESDEDTDSNEEDLDDEISSDDKEEILKIKTEIFSPKVVFSGIPFELYSETTTNRGEKYEVGNFVWNFGDGMSLKSKNSEAFNYVYDYPGEYVLILSYYRTSFSEVPEATDKINLKVLPSSINISSIGSLSDPYVEIENKSSYEISLKDWSINTSSNFFLIPEGTIILPNKKIKFSPKITGFKYEDLDFVSIIDPNKNNVASYPSFQKSNILKNSNIVKSNNLEKIEEPKSFIKEELVDSENNIINLNDLSSSTGDSKIKINPLILSVLGLIVIVFTSLYVLFSFKKKRKEEDLENLEGEISEKDITLIE